MEIKITRNGMIIAACAALIIAVAAFITNDYLTRDSPAERDFRAEMRRYLSGSEGPEACQRIALLNDDFITALIGNAGEPEISSDRAAEIIRDECRDIY